MNIKHAFIIAFANLRGKKLSSVILPVVAALCITAVSAAASIAGGLTMMGSNIKNAVLTRTLFTNIDEKPDLEALKKLDGVAYAGEYYGNFYMNIDSCSYKYKGGDDYKQNGSTLSTKFYNIIPNVIAGQNIEPDMTGVAIVPKGFMPCFKYKKSGFHFRNGAEYFDGEDFLGQTITFRYERQKDFSQPPEAEGNTEIMKYTFKIIGVYDDVANISDGFSDTIFISGTDMKKIYTENSPRDKTFHFCCVASSPEAVAPLEQKLATMGYFCNLMNAVAPHFDDDMTSFQISTAITSLIILGLLFVVICILMFMSVKKQTSQLAVMKATGYTNRDIRRLLSAECTLLWLFSLLLGSVFTAALVLLWRPFTEFFIERSISHMPLVGSVTILSFLAASALLLVSYFAGMLLTFIKSKKVSPAEALKE